VGHRFRRARFGDYEVKVVHVPFCYYPDPSGGTEVYVKSLVLELARLGVDGAIAAPGHDEVSYTHEGHSVHRFSVDRLKSFDRAYGVPDPVAAESFAKILERERPAVVHLHALTSAVSVLLVNAAQAAGARVVFTYHTPSVSCVRETLMRWGHVPCDGVMTVRRCTACNLERHGVPALFSALLAHVPPALGRGLERSGAAGGPWTALRMRSLVEERQESTRGFLETVDHVVAVCDWVHRVLLANGVPARRLSLSRQGLPFATVNGTGQQAEGTNTRQSLRIVFLGRLDRVKGLDVLADALRDLPGLPITVDIFGVSQSRSADAYTAAITRAAENDPRLALKPPLDPREVVSLLRRYDLVAVPSRCFETGPLVVLEAFAAGVPVIGSAVGGIAELVSDGIDGVLVPSDDVSAWSSVLRRLLDDPARLTQLRRGVKQPRRMIAVAREMKALYLTLVEPSHCPGKGVNNIPSLAQADYWSRNS
jgi:glycosyltransferase involved in cell wall biosynthesis